MSLTEDARKKKNEYQRMKYHENKLRYKKYQEKSWNKKATKEEGEQK